MSTANQIDVITIGGATLDIFVRADGTKIISLREENYCEDFLAYPYGHKLYLDSIFYASGGGGNNTAVAFARQGLTTAFIGCVGQDEEGRRLLMQLKKEGVRTDYVNRISEASTGVSIILNSFEGDRTVLSFRGGNNLLAPDVIPWDALKNCRWLYLPSLSGEAGEIIPPLLGKIKNLPLKLAINPGKDQLALGMTGLAALLKRTDTLIINKEEAESLTGKKARHYAIDEDIAAVEVMRGEPWISNLKPILQMLHDAGPEVVVVTEGVKGAQAYDGKDYYWMPVYPFPPVDTLGAGDAFASAFVGSRIQGGPLTECLRYGAASGALVVQQLGAIAGLSGREELQEMIESHRDTEPVLIYQ